MSRGSTAPQRPTCEPGEGELRRVLRELQTTSGPHPIEVARVSHEFGRMLAVHPQLGERRGEAESLFAQALERARVLWSAAESITVDDQPASAERS